MHSAWPSHIRSSKIYTMSYTSEMKKALDEVDNSDTPNITAIAKKHSLYPSTLNVSEWCKRAQRSSSRRLD
jgi:hypothetical protein